LAELRGSYYYGTGRRKTAVARVRLFPGGDGTIIVNGKDSNQYFGREALTSNIRAPLRLLEVGSRFNASVRVVGGGVSGQAGAVRHGIARALVRADEAWKPTLKKSGLSDARPAHERAQEVWFETRSQGSTVHQALTPGSLAARCAH
jgi:small subunit ribosomal protein S9